jgi:putative spermidine/putrescine transport system permease protein
VNRFFRYLYDRPKLRLALLLALPLLWLLIAYLGSLFLMLISSFWGVDDFTGNIVHKFSFANFQTIFSQSVYLTIGFRTIVVALAVTLIDACLALPIAFFIAKVLKPRFRSVVISLMLIPLWASYLVKTYAWRTIFSDGGVLAWLLKPLHITAPSYGLLATTLTLAYLWLPYMILPIYAGFERLPNSLLEASSDLGGSSGQTFRNVIFPLIYPSIIAGSIFTFSLSLGDYIVVKIVGGTTQLMANVIADNIGTAGNIPFASALAIFPIIVILIYLTAVRKFGALENI